MCIMITFNLLVRAHNYFLIFYWHFSWFIESWFLIFDWKSSESSWLNVNSWFLLKVSLILSFWEEVCQAPWRGEQSDWSLLCVHMTSAIWLVTVVCHMTSALSPPQYMTTLSPDNNILHHLRIKDAHHLDPNKGLWSPPNKGRWS